MQKLVIHTDGGARGNPGPAGVGFVIESDGKIFKKCGEYIGKATNNQAEYRALISALESAKELGGEDIDVLMDSELIVKQIKGEYKVKHPELAPLFLKFYNLKTGFKKFSIRHIPREKNKEADRLVNEAIDKAGF